MVAERTNRHSTRYRLTVAQGSLHVRTILRALRIGHIVHMELVPWGTNGTFAVVLEQTLVPNLIAIYKPARGEAPLWDFPCGTLYRREYAAYLLSRILGWSFVPPTVIRDGPYGVGTVQLYVEPHDRPVRGHHYRAQLQRIAFFDLLTNNADRKASHLFLGRYDRRIWGIDHGLTFHVDPKLRTILWEFCGEPIPSELLADVRRLLSHRRWVDRLLAPFLADEERQQFWHRCAHYLSSPIYPPLNPRRNIPYGW